MTIRLLIADDHHVVRAGLRSLLHSDPELEVVGEAATGTEAVQLAAELHPDVVLIDLVMPGLDGVAATAAIRDALPGVEVLVLTGVPEQRGLEKAVRAGAIGYLSKNVACDDLCSAIKGAVAGRAQLSARAVQWLICGDRDAASSPLLTPRERDVITLLAGGLANKEIARTLQIGETTVKSHVRHILAKLGVQSRTQAAIVAAERGLAAKPDRGA